jgi:hypothetical protein
MVSLLNVNTRVAREHIQCIEGRNGISDDMNTLNYSNLHKIQLQVYNNRRRGSSQMQSITCTRDQYIQTPTINQREHSKILLLADTLLRIKLLEKLVKKCNIIFYLYNIDILLIVYLQISMRVEGFDYLILNIELNKITR